ncbi:protein of unknown function [Burkholderia multivorans]
MHLVVVVVESGARFQATFVPVFVRAARGGRWDMLSRGTRAHSHAATPAGRAVPATGRRAGQSVASLVAQPDAP